MKNKVAIITGGSSGIGFSLAEAFLKEGCKVVISGREEKRLKEAELKLSQISKDVFSIQGDVSIESDCKFLVNETVKRFGGIDVLVNNAGISMRALFSDTDLDVIRKLMNINFYGAIYCSKFALPFLLANRGSIVGISSIAGKIGLPARTGYSASKFAMEGFLESLRTENLNTGLHVLTVCPGFTASNIRNTALTGDGASQGESPRDEKKMMQPEEVAKEIVRAIKNRKRSLILTSEGIMAVMFKKFFPALLERMIFNKIRKEKNSPLK